YRRSFLRPDRCSQLPGSDGVRQRDPRYGSEADASDGRGWHCPDEDTGEAGQPRREEMAAANGRGSGPVQYRPSAQIAGSGTSRRRMGRRKAHQ
ncbi:ATP-binding cassette sub-family C member 8 isoform 1, partial [Corchorus olitorius]